MDILNSILIISAMLALLIGLKFCLEKYIPASWQYRLDYLFFVILFMPFIPFKSMKSTAQAAATSTAVINGKPDLSQTGMFNDFAVDNKAGAIGNIFIYIWLAGVALVLLTMVFSVLKLYRISKKAAPVSEDIDWMFKKCCNEIGLSGNIKLKRGDVNIPMIFGVFNTVIILPDLIMPSKDIRNILLHELVHFKRGDTALNYLMALFKALYWFNPIVWMAFRLMKNDREISCDEAVIEKTGDSYGYGLTIIRFIHTEGLLSMAADMGGSKNQIKKRIEAAAAFTEATNADKLRSTFIFLTALILILTRIPAVSVLALDSKPKYNMDRYTEADMSQYFKGFDGGFVLYDLNNDEYTVYNEDAVQRRVSPNSTYKIYSALSAFESGIIDTEDNFMTWEGDEYSISEWNADQDLNSAMKNSVNWYFENLDRQSSINDFLTKINFGNCDFSGGLTSWLQSSLKISPVEQTNLLKAFYTNEYGLKDENIEAVKEAIEISNGFYGKTGTGKVNGHEINGWFIGFAESCGNVYFYALNIQGEDNASGSKAAEIAIEILSDRGIINYEN